MKDAMSKTVIAGAVDGFTSTMNLIESRDAIIRCQEQGFYFIFGKNKIGEYLKFNYGLNEGFDISDKYYLAEDILYMIDNAYYEKLNHKFGRKDYLNKLGVKDYQIANVKLSSIKKLQEVILGEYKPMVYKQANHGRLLLVHESALKVMDCVIYNENHNNIIVKKSK